MKTTDARRPERASSIRRRPTRTHLVATVSSLAAAVALVAGVLSATAPLTPATPTAAPVACTDVAVVTVEQAADLTGTCDYAGVTIDIGDGRTIGFPAAGTTLVLDALAAGGADDASDADAVVQRTPAGRVSVLLGQEAHEAHEAHAPHADAGALGTSATAAVPASTSCAASARTAFVKTGRSWPGAYTWKSNDSGRPSSNSTSVIDAAFKTMASGGTRCGAGATVATRASAVLAGTTTARPAITTAGSCTGARDKVNVVGWQQLPKGILGLTCVVYSGSTILEADIAFSSSQSWFSSTSATGCKGTRYDLSTAASHELGHALGLGHVAASTGQTMKPSIPPCDFSSRLKGVGDAAGLAAVYPKK